MADDMIKFLDVDRYQFVDEQVFRNIQGRSRPAILENCYFGDCMNKWDLNYLNEKLGGEQIVIHESDESDLDFLRKNFKYRTCLFSQFSQQLMKHQTDNENKNLHLYLRSTNRDPRSKKPARIEHDFPILNDDLQPPNYIPFREDNKLYHSSILRIASSNVQVWTHFDLYDNVLCQIVGVKRVILFGPDDIKHLYIEGDKSPVNDFDDLEKCLRLYPLLGQSKPYRCLLRPGETLYIPSLWWHNIRTVVSEGEDEGHSIGFNVFWRDSELLDRGHPLYAERDVYGNKNLIPFESALANLDKALDHLDKLPGKYRMFYKIMLFERLKFKLFSADKNLDK